MLTAEKLHLLNLKKSMEGLLQLVQQQLQVRIVSIYLPQLHIDSLEYVIMLTDHEQMTPCLLLISLSTHFNQALFYVVTVCHYKYILN